MNALWDDPARDYRSRWQTPEHFLWDPAEPKMIDYKGYVSLSLAMLPDPPCTVFDVGCGDGWVARAAVMRGYSVVGIDYSERAIGFARLLTPEAEFHLADARCLHEQHPWRGAFDAALCVEVLEHIDGQYHADVVSGIAACLKPGGTLVVAVPSEHMPTNRWHYQHFTRDECVKMLESAGLRVEHIVGQHQMSMLWSPNLWRFLRNRVYDLRAARNAMRAFLLSRRNSVPGKRRAGRYVIRSVMPD